MHACLVQAACMAQIVFPAVYRCLCTLQCLSPTWHHRAAQAGDASGTGLFDTANRQFDIARMHSIDPSLPEFFPELVGPNEVTGRGIPSAHAWALSHCA